MFWRSWACPDRRLLLKGIGDLWTALKNFRNVHIKAKLYGDWLKENAESQLFNFKDKLPEINTIFAHNDSDGFGCQGSIE